MKQVMKTCPYCKTSRPVPYKHRNGPGYCNLKCVYASRVTKVKNKACEWCRKPNSVLPTGKYCSHECSHAGYKGFKHSEDTKQLMKERWTDCRKQSVMVLRVDKVCAQCGQVFQLKETDDKRFCSERCYWDHLSVDNHMKSPEMRERLSIVAANRSPELNARIGQGVSRAWARGDFEGARVGQCDWYSFKLSSGEICKVQGTWELAFVDWLDTKGMEFTVHRGWIPYIDENGVARNWYPDFLVEDWGAWIDVKCEHFYNQTKFDRISECNPAIGIGVLLEKDLNDLGIQIYGRGGFSDRVKYLMELSNALW